MIDRAVRLCGADNGNIARHEGDVFRVVAFTSHSPEYERLVRGHVYVPERRSVIGRTLLERKVIQIADVLANPGRERRHPRRPSQRRGAAGRDPDRPADARLDRRQRRLRAGAGAHAGGFSRPLMTMRVVALRD